MIYTITLNPAIDYVVHMEKVNVGDINRSEREEIYVGGKGINVSNVLAQLNVRSKALGFVAGFTGAVIRSEIGKLGIEEDFVEVKEGFSRINVKIMGETETQINGTGPHIDEAALNSFFEKLSRVEDGDTVVLAGNAPKILGKDIYEKIIASQSHKDIRWVVDATKELLLSTLKHRPFLIKPNLEELEEIFGEPVLVTEVVSYGRRLQEAGARNVLISMGHKGAVLIDEEGRVYEMQACTGEVKNTVGAGDSMVAGFIAGCESRDYGYALRLASACGGATAFSEGLARRDDIYKLLENI